ncbi:hypothetical protein [Limnobacter sp.]|uniref:hypothetical protein n=1 Tax=Limnobacter sp. TaxID=2003368 RepID=UPI00351544D5
MPSLTTRQSRWRCAALFAVGLLLAGQAKASERFPHVMSPMDHFLQGDVHLAVETRFDQLQAQGPFPLGKALFTIGRTDLLGLNPSLNSFEVSTLEVPLGGNFAVDQEEPVAFSQARQAQKAQRPNRQAFRGVFRGLMGTPF